MGCLFVEVLSQLQKHSSESVDFVDELSDQSRYLHVDRPIQSCLTEVLNEESSKENKSLVLLCGSAGDGKSHMLSYLKNQSGQAILNGFLVRNDATESDAPNRTAPETLADALCAFNDEHLDDGGNEKIVVAINLGLLSRFLEEPAGEKFSRLKASVDRCGLLKTGVSNTDDAQEPAFRAIDFSDYQIFTLKDGDVRTDFIDELFEKIFREDEENCFFQASINSCAICHADKSLCPVRHNYEYLKSRNVQRTIARIIVEIALHECCVITARAVLNLIYDLIVSPTFDIDELSELAAIDVNAFASKYLSMTTPQLLYSSVKEEELVSKAAKLDPTDDPTGFVDELAIKLQASSEYIKQLSPYISGTPYEAPLNSFAGFERGSLKRSTQKTASVKSDLLKFIVRCAYLSSSEPSGTKDVPRVEYVDDFAKILFSYNTGDNKGLKNLKKALAKAIEDWNGDYPSGYSLLRTYGDVQLLQKVKVQSKKTAEKNKPVTNLEKFRPYIVIEATLKDKEANEFIPFQIDYNLYCLLRRIGEGYQPTLMDKNLFSSFENSYELLLEQGSKKSEICLARRSSGKKPFADIRLDEDDEFSAEGVQ